MNCEPRTTATTATHAKAYVFASLIAAALFSYPATAQTPVPETTSAAANLRIAPRIGAGYDTSGGGYDGFTRFEGFLPLVQTSGNNLWFLEGRLLLDNGAHLGSNILVGYRTYTPGLNRAFGGYIGYDTRNTGDSTFNQLGLGVESLGAIWDFRLNGYIPIGDTRQVAATRGFDTGLQLTGSPVFQGNSLLLPGERRFGQTTIREAAMGGVDFEIGAKIAQFTNGGDLRGYGGLYYYNASGSPSFVGGRLRLEIRPTDYLKLGLGLQHDDQFGTNLLVSIGATFPGTRPQGSRGEDESVWLRMGESVSRTASILVDEQVESAGFTQQSTLVATNPVTGKPYVFRHVNQGIGTGDGTAENPTGTVATALNEAQYDDIVYVQPGANTGIPAFTIPDGVQVLSTGPVQQINTAEFGLVRLTGSGAGVLPAVTGTVTMGNDSVLSGFAITSTSGPGIVARTIGNGTIRDNQVTSFSEAGVLLENPTGAITLTNNAIAGNGVPALVGININNVTLTGGSLTSTDSATNGITLNGVRGIFDLSSTPVTVTNAKGSGLLATNISGTVNLTTTGSQISTTGAEAGLKVENSTGAVNLSGLVVTSTGGPVLQGTMINNLAIANSTLTSNNSATSGISLNGISGTVDVTNSQIAITNPVQNGLLATNISGTVNLTTTGSQISTTGAEAGLKVENSTGAVNLSGLVVTSTGGPVLQGTMINNLAITNSTLTSTNSATSGISLNGVNGTVDVTNSGIAITNPAQNGLFATNISGQVNLTAISGSQINTTGAEAGLKVENSTGAVNLSGLVVTSTGGPVLQGTTINNLAIANSTLTSNNSATSGISLNGVSGTVDVTNSGITITNPVQNGLFATNISGTVNFTANSGSQITTTGTEASIKLDNNPGSVNLSGLAVTSTGGLVLQGTAINNLVIANSTLIGTNALTNGISLDGVSGTATIAANAGSKISNSGSFGVAFSNSPGAIALSGLEITDSGDSGIFGNNLAALTLQNNIITRATNQGILLVDSNGSFAISNNQIANTNGVAPVGIFDPPGGQGIALANVTGSVALTGNAIAGTKAPTRTPLPSGGQGIALANSTGNVNLTISGNNQISTNNDDGILVALVENATGNITISGNTIDNSGKEQAVPSLRGDGIKIAIEENAAVTNLIISGNNISNNVDDGIDISLGLAASQGLPGIDPSNAQLNNATISNNTAISNNGQNGIVLRTFGNSRMAIDFQTNTLTNNGAIGFQAATQGTSTFCLDLKGNNSSTGYQLTEAVVSTFQVVDLGNVGVNNTGTVTVEGGIDNLNNLADCP